MKSALSVCPLVIGAFLLAGVVEASPLELVSDQRFVRLVTTGGQSTIEPSEAFGQFNEGNQFSSVSASALFGTGRASSPDASGEGVIESVYEVRFRAPDPVALTLAGSLIRSGASGAGYAQVRLTSNVRPYFGGPVYELTLDSDSPSTQVEFNEVIALNCHALYTLTVRSSVPQNSTDLFASWFLDAVARVEPQADSDGDGVADALDNCVFDANAAQIDANGDGFGNRCDIDYNNDLIPGVIDLGILRASFFTNAPVIDVNSDGIVNAADLGLFRQLYFQPPGPTGAQGCSAGRDHQ